MKSPFLIRAVKYTYIAVTIVTVMGIVILFFVDEGKDIGGFLFFVWILIPLAIIFINGLVAIFLNLYLRDNIWKLLAGTLITTIPYSLIIIFFITDVANDLELNGDFLLLLIFLGHLVVSGLGVYLVRHFKSLN